jgi:hypothetical protein
MRKTIGALTLLLAAFQTAPAAADTHYYEGWDAGSTAGWFANTLSCQATALDANGNPLGYLRSLRDDEQIVFIGALANIPEASGNYAAAGIRRVSFDLLNETAQVVEVAFRVRWEGPTHNGWNIPLATSLPLQTWTSFDVFFDPNWSDDEALGAGWRRDNQDVASFATTMSDVFFPEIRIRTIPVAPSGGNVGDIVGIDNFRLTSCTNDVDGPTADVSVSRDSLWPPTHKMMSVCATVHGSDLCDPSPEIDLVSVVSNEPDAGLGGGDQPGDIEILSDFCFNLRSERDPKGSGRTYTITYDVTDLAGNTTTLTAEVTVPASQQGNARPAGGFSPQGKSLLRTAENITLVIPSTTQFAASGIDAGRTLIGNHLGTVAPVEVSRYDATGDRLEDLVLSFPATATRELIERAGTEIHAELAIPSDNNIREFSGPESATVGLYYEARGISYLVEDILTLGVPVRQLVNPSDDDAPAAAPRDGSKPGPGLMTLAQGGRVVVEIFNIQGQKIRTLIDREMSAGTVPLAWDGRGDSGRQAPNGIYFTRIAAPGIQESRKVFLNR